MGFIKKNLIFCLVVLICLLAFGAGVWLAFSASGKVEGAERQLSSTRSQLANLAQSSPALSEANVAASEANVRELMAELAAIREDLQRGSRLKTSDDGVGVMAAIQQYISDFQRMAEERINANGEPDPIGVEDDFAFGFEQYIDQATVPDDVERIPLLDKQRQILSYLLNQLIEADPDSIEAVRRELLEATAESSDRDGFRISPAVSARVPGAIDTMAFSLTFTGYTDVLRDFLNNLTRFELPIVVRSVAVERPSGRETVAAPTGGGDGLDAIFGAFGGGSEDEVAPTEAQEPVIAENISRFTVVVEFIEIVLPETTTDETSDSV